MARAVTHGNFDKQLLAAFWFSGGFLLLWCRHGKQLRPLLESLWGTCERRRKVADRRPPLSFTYKNIRFFLLYQIFFAFFPSHINIVMVPDPFVNNIVYIAALAQTAVAPLAFVYYVYYIATEHPLFTTSHAAIDVLLHYWLGCELIFYVFFQITRSRMQRTLPAVYPELKERRSVYYNCISNIDDVDEWLTGWFMKGNNPSQHPKLCEIRRENLAEWCVSLLETYGNSCQRH